MERVGIVLSTGETGLHIIYYTYRYSWMYSHTAWHTSAWTGPLINGNKYFIWWHFFFIELATVVFNYVLDEQLSLL